MRVCVMRACACTGYQFSPDSVSTVDSAVLTYHRVAEAMKFAYARRSELGDDLHLAIDEVPHGQRERGREGGGGRGRERGRQRVDRGGERRGKEAEREGRER